MRCTQVGQAVKRLDARQRQKTFFPFPTRSQAQKKKRCFEVAELVFTCVSGRFQVLGEGLVTNGGIRKGTVTFRNVLISMVSLLF